MSITNVHKLDPHLLPPLTFTHSPSSSAPSRGSTPIASKLLRHPTSGRDHLILRFYVHGRGKDEPETLGYVKRGLRTAEEWALYAFDAVGLDLRRAPPAKEDEVEVVAQPAAESSGWLKTTFGSLSTLRASGGSTVARGRQRGLPPPGTYKSGEVKADYVKVRKCLALTQSLTLLQNAAGTFTLLTLVIDIPHSQAPHPQHAVIFRSPEADTEGLLGGRYR
jgi:import inner membrane translocase subunit TIM21